MTQSFDSTVIDGESQKQFVVNPPPTSFSSVYVAPLDQVTDRYAQRHIAS